MMKTKRNKYKIGYSVLILCFIVAILSSCTEREDCTVCTKILYWETNINGVLTKDTSFIQSAVMCSDEEREAYSAEDGTISEQYFSNGYKFLKYDTRI